MTRTCLVAVAVSLLSACVSKGTYNASLTDLANARSVQDELREEMVRRQAADSAYRAEVAQLTGEWEGQRDQLEARIAVLEEEAASLDMFNAQAGAENRRLEAALAERGSEYRQLQERLQTLSAIEAEIRDRNRIYEAVIGRFQSLIDGGQLTVAIVRGRMVIQLPQDILFESGSSTVGREGRETLTEVGTVLATLEGRRFQVEGHTDNVPISTARFPSNWELSSARALSVVALLVQAGVAPQNLSGAGYGEFQPVADNEDRESRRQNRRIEIVMLPNLDVIATTSLLPA